MAQDLSPYYFIVDNALRDLGLEPNQCRGDLPGQWNLAYGEITVGIDLWEVEEQDEKIVFQVQTPVMTLPKSKTGEFCKELCEINYVLYAVSFSIVDGTVYLKTMRDAGDIKHQDVLTAIEYCGYYAEHYQKALLEKYGGKRL